MNRVYYFNYIEEKLSVLVTRVEMRGSLNILDFNIHSENFYLYFLNTLFGLNLKNLNTEHQNTQAIDLIDSTKKIIIQVSSTASKPKISSTLEKIDSSYKGYSLIFVPIVKDASSLKSQKYNIPPKVTFDPKKNIYDIKTILKSINGLEISEIRHFFEFIKKELGTETDIKKLDTNLASIINILSKEDWDKDTLKSKIEPFEIENKIQYNELQQARTIISDYAMHHPRVEKIYNTFNASGVNKSASVLSTIRNIYVKNKNNINKDALFFKVVDATIAKIAESSNYNPIPFEELELCVNILVVDSFVRCKIFENPKDYKNASA